MSSNYFIYNERYFTQINGTPIGQPLSVVFAVIVMQYIDSKNFQNTDQLIKFWRRHADDVYVFAHSLNFYITLNHANLICSSIQLTLDN